MNMPGFNAELSLRPTRGAYRRGNLFGGLEGEVMPQFRLQSQADPDIGAYLRCRTNGGSDLICRFFAGLPPFTIGRLLM